jgi:hypothetical protein
MLQFVGGIVLGTAITLAGFLFLQRSLPSRRAQIKSSNQPVGILK